LIKCLAHTEAVIDFGDDDRENDIDDSVMWKICPKVRKLLDELNCHLKRAKQGELVRDGIRIVLSGPPNAGMCVMLHVPILCNLWVIGKSSLLNSLARRPAAIVSPIAGTTRFITQHNS
jgi:tRNA modification GTPase